MWGRPSGLESEGVAMPSKTLRSEKLDLRLLLISPGMALQIVVERLIAAVEGRDLILLFEPTD
jgi:hypothetical protein